MLREIILEHLFVGRLLQRCWQAGAYDVEVLRSEFDSGGYDLVVTRGAITRHIQFKALRVGGKRRHFDIGLRLAARPAGCVIAIVVDDDLEARHYLWFGGTSPDSALPPIDDCPAARHTKADSTGAKAARNALRRVPTSRFEKLDSLDAVIGRLIGKLP
ncbi:hypothetical protein [Sediminimonas sp.]|uniref:hypothetical protein n=1 Tax=Sediminimonas sp. TaxID=2823379 RepID=UPI0025E12D76|nr:hypothetical protein [Sediminimonas sp.]